MKFMKYEERHARRASDNIIKFGVFHRDDHEAMIKYMAAGNIQMAITNQCCTRSAYKFIAMNQKELGLCSEELPNRD